MSDQNNNHRDENNSKEAGDWGRHFDTLLWTVTAIMAAAISGLLAYVHNSVSAGKKLDIFLASSGYFLTLATVYLATSFRVLRHEFKEHYTKKIQDIFNSSKRLYQWPVYILIFVILLGLWIKLLIEHSVTYLGLWVVFVFIGGFVIGYCWKIGKGK